MELSLGIVFFTNIVLSLGALIYIVTGINTDLFIWAKDYIVSLKDEDSAVNAKVSPVVTSSQLLLDGKGTCEHWGMVMQCRVDTACIDHLTQCL